MDHCFPTMLFSVGPEGYKCCDHLVSECSWMNIQKRCTEMWASLCTNRVIILSVWKMNWYFCHKMQCDKLITRPLEVICCSLISNPARIIEWIDVGKLADLMVSAEKSQHGCWDWSSHVQTVMKTRTIKSNELKWGSLFDNSTCRKWEVFSQLAPYIWQI